jgi:hypothetical protein
MEVVVDAAVFGPRRLDEGREDLAQLVARLRLCDDRPMMV